MIEGGLENWPAINWTLESLKEKVGGNEVNVRVNTNCEEYRVGVITEVCEGYVFIPVCHSVQGGCLGPHPGGEVGESG